MLGSGGINDDKILEGFASIHFERKHLSEGEYLNSKVRFGGRLKLRNGRN